MERILWCLDDVQASLKGKKSAIKKKGDELLNLYRKELEDLQHKVKHAKADVISQSVKAYFK
jgi:hypothetical protein